MSHNDTIDTIDSIAARPVAVTRLTHYYQGRPNSVFLDRYHTAGTRRTVRPA